MFTIRTVRGRLAIVAIALLATSVGACIPPDTEDPASAPAETGQEQDAGDEDTGSDAVADEDEPDEDAEPEAGTPGITTASMRTCHDRSDAGGNSDVVLELQLTGFPAGALVEVLVTSSVQGDAAVTGTVGDDGVAIVLMPAVEYGEQFSVSGINVDNTPVDQSGVDLTHTVPDDTGSDCTNHPSA